MNKKRIKLFISLIAMVLLLTGCSQSEEIISLETPFSEVTSDGFFSAIITYPLAQAINIVSSKTGIVWGITIVTVLLNVIVVALTFKSSVNMQKMQELQPELSRIQAKYEGRTDDMSQQRMSMEMQQLYAKYDINPIGSLLTTFIQFPLLIGMYSAIRRSEAVRNATFLGVSLSQSPKEALASKVWLCVIIFVLMVIFQYLSINVVQWINNARAKKEAEKHHKTYQKPQQQNAMMNYSMILMIALVMYSLPTALSLYYCIYSIINIVKTFIIDKLSHKEN